MNQRSIPVTNEIGLFLHCRKCVNSVPSGMSPLMWARLEVGWTAIGLQVWCSRHKLNVMHMDFQGQKHPANLLAEAAS
jgi:hypothetical protein